MPSADFAFFGLVNTSEFYPAQLPNNHYVSCGNLSYSYADDYRKGSSTFFVRLGRDGGVVRWIKVSFLPAALRTHSSSIFLSYAHTLTRPRARLCVQL